MYFNDLHLFITSKHIYELYIVTLVIWLIDFLFHLMFFKDVFR